MKKAILILMLLLIPFSAQAQTREDLAVDLTRIFEVSNAGTVQALFGYGDWLSISADKRESVISAVNIGLFTPESGQYYPKAQVDNEARLTAINGIDRLVFTNTGYQKMLGSVTGVGENSVTIKADDGISDHSKWLDCALDTPFLTENGMSKASGVSVGDEVALVADEAGGIKIIWKQKKSSQNTEISDYELVAVRQGNLYLYDDPRFLFIVTGASQRIFSDWTAIETKYDDLLIHDKAKVFAHGQEVYRESLNLDWLDRKIQYIIGKNPLDGGKMKVLHSEFE